MAKIDWEYETLETGMETWNTQVRGFIIEIRKSPAVDSELQVSISVGALPLHQYEVGGSPNDAMFSALNWVSQYWKDFEPSNDSDVDGCV